MHKEDFTVILEDSSLQDISIANMSLATRWGARTGPEAVSPNPLELCSGLSWTFLVFKESHIGENAGGLGIPRKWRKAWALME